MIASLLFAAAAVLPPEGPFIWKGEELPLTEPVKYYRIAPMTEPVLVDTPFVRYRGDDVDMLARQFAQLQSETEAFSLFKRLAVRQDTNEWETVASACDYLLQFAASKGHRQALEFFDQDGKRLTGYAFEYVIAQYRHYWSDRSLTQPPKGTLGYGAYSETSIRPYPAEGELKELLDKYEMTAKWFEDQLPFLEFTPNDCPTNEVPLIVYIPGSGEQGTNIVVQFNQRACLEKVVSSEFQQKHPCRFMVICLPDRANWNIGHGYPMRRDARSELYNDMILAYAKQSDSPKVDPRRIYLTGLGSGASIVAGMTLDHPGRYAAAAPVWYFPIHTYANPDIPGNWRIYNNINPFDAEDQTEAKTKEYYAGLITGFTENARASGGDCTFHYVPRDTPWPWWDLVWKGDEVYAWLFSKTAPAGEREEF